MRPVLVLLGILLGLAMAPFPQAPSVASCAGPYLRGADPLVIQRGVPATVEGRSFADGCQDTGSCSVGPGCDSCDYGPAPTPMENVELRLRQHGRTWTLGTADAEGGDHLGWVAWVVELPGGVGPGRATLLAGTAQPVQVRIR